MEQRDIKEYKCPRCGQVVKAYGFEDFVFTALYGRCCKSCGAFMEEMLKTRAGEITRPENYTIGGR